MSRRPGAVVQLFDPEQPTELQLEMVACCHCGKYHPMRGAAMLLAGGVRVLDYCSRCDGVHCPSCVQCVPVEQRLENIEAGRPLLASRPTSILVPG